MRCPIFLDISTQLTPGGSRVLSGRPEGAAARKRMGLDIWDTADEAAVMVVAFSPILALTTSFWIGCFGPSVRALGETRFRERYRFNDPVFRSVAEDGIREALREGTPLRTSRPAQLPWSRLTWTERVLYVLQWSLTFR